MKVICAGLPKTGTKSMHAALEKLGYSVHDYYEAVEYFENEYIDFIDRGWEVSYFRGMYENIDAVVAAPSCHYWEELVEAFPEAKVVLTIREDDNTWLKSSLRQFSLIDNVYFWYYPFLSPSWRKFWRFLCNSACPTYSFKKITGFETSRQALIKMVLKQVYRRHVAHVLNKCPKDRLLVFNCKSGWKPLCEFLDKSVPDGPFPKVNVSGGQQSALIWQIDILKQATKEVRIWGYVLAAALAVTGYIATRNHFLKSFWR